MPSTSSKIAMGRVVIIGDSLSVTHLQNGKQATTPGSQLAFLLAAKGHQVSVDAIGGFALAYFRPAVAHTKQGLQAERIIARTKDAAPDTVLVMLGTNDYADSNKALQGGISAIIGAFSGPGMQPNLIFIGPPAFSPALRGGAVYSGTNAVYTELNKSLRPVIDARPLTRDMLAPPLRAGDGIHFSGKGAKLFAERLAGTLSMRETVTRGINWGLSQTLTVLGLLDLIVQGPLTTFIRGRKKRATK